MRKPTAISLTALIGLAAGLWGAAILPSARTARRQLVSRLHRARASTTSDRSGRSSSRPAQVPQSGQAQRRALARDVCRCARRRAQRRSGASRQQRRQPDRSPRHRQHRTADAQGRAAARRRVDRAHPLVDRSRGPSDAFGRARAGAVGSAARAQSASDSSRPLAVVVVNNPIDSSRRISPSGAPWSPRRCRTRSSRVACISTSGVSSPTRRAARLSRRSFTSQTQELVARLLARRSKYADHWVSFWNDLLRNEDGVTIFQSRRAERALRIGSTQRSSGISRTISSSTN